MPDFHTAQLLPSPYDSYAIALAFGYFLGSIPFARMMNHLSHAEEVPESPDGKLRVLDLLAAGHRGLAAMALAGDISKGLLAAALPSATWDIDMGILSAFGAFLGHLYPVFAKFRGGSGIAPYFGALFLFHPQSALIMGLVWLLTLLATRYATLASVVAVVLVPFSLIAFDQWPYIQLFGGLAALVVVRNISNLYRLINGHEPKVTL